MRNLIKRILHPFLKKWYDRKAKNPYSFEYKSIRITIYPGVFSPTLTISTKLFIDFIETLELEQKRILELGAGSGIISFFCAQQKAQVTASDISDNAIAGLEKNAKALSIPIHIVKTPFFKDMDEAFDFIFINPPYYRRDPQNEEEKAWFCGSSFEYFQGLFSGISQRNYSDEAIFMILSEDCELEQIKTIANDYACTLNEVQTLKRWKETNHIYRIQRT